MTKRHRIIEIEGVPSCDSLCVAMLRDEQKENFIEISAWHFTDTEDVLFQVDQIRFDDDRMNEKFINELSQTDANCIANRFYKENVLALNEEARADILKQVEKLSTIK